MALIPIDVNAMGEMIFALQNGYPEAIVSVCDRTLYRTKDGGYWERHSSSEFVSVPRQEGHRIEKELARQTFNVADRQFNLSVLSPAFSGLFGNSHSSKSIGKSANSSSGQMFFGQIQSGALGLAEHAIQNVGNFIRATELSAANAVQDLSNGTNNLCVGKKMDEVAFAGLLYLHGSQLSGISYSPMADVSRYYISQGMDECVSAAILNAQIFAGKSFTPDRDFLVRVHNKLLGVTGKTGTENRRLNIGVLIYYIRNKQLVPGLTVERCENIDSSLAHHDPIVALVPHFKGHAVAIVGKGDTPDSYRAIDTVTGFEQEIDKSQFLDVSLYRVTDVDAFKKWVGQN